MGVSFGNITTPGHPPSQVFTAPAGLQGFLGTRATGRNPDTMPELVASGLDLTPFYLLGLQPRFVQATLTPAAAGIAGAPTSLTVPQGKVWIPLMHSVRAYAGGAGDSIDALPAVTNASAPTTLYWSHTDASGAASAASGRQQVSTHEYFKTPLLVPAGFVFTAYVRLIVVAVAPAVDIGLWFCEIDGP